MQKAVIFDFDGTIADTSMLIRGVYNEMGAERGWPVMNEVEYQRLRELGLVEAQRWTGVKPWQVPGLMREGLKRFKLLSQEVKLFPGIPELMGQLVTSGQTLYVLSTNAPEIIGEVLGRYDLKNSVTVLKRSPLFSKHYAIRSLISKNKYQHDNVWMVGDEVRDIEAGKHAGVNTVAVTWGLESNELLLAAQPTALASSPKELSGILINTIS